MHALAKGKPLYSADTLRAYVKEDLDLIERYRPDVVVGDFRISLSVSARVAGVPYLTISNSYWSPYADLSYPVPELPIVDLLGPRVAAPLFHLVRPMVFALHSRPLNRVRREYGLETLGRDLRRVYTDADITLYADVPQMFPTHGSPVSHRFVGAVPWQPPDPLPPWWDELDRARPWIFVTLGSSGPAHLLPAVLDALSDLPVQVVAASAGRVAPKTIPANARVTKFLPGRDAAARSSLVICNGGSPVVQLALINGVPTVNICSNMDQYLNTDGVLRVNAGVRIRAGEANVENIRHAAVHALEDQALKAGALAMQEAFSAYRATELFRAAVDELSATQNDRE